MRFGVMLVKSQLKFMYIPLQILTPGNNYILPHPFLNWQLI